MTREYTQFQIQTLRSVNQQRLLEAILVFIVALFVSALLPSLMVQYLYADQVLLEAPVAIEHMSGVIFSLAMLYLVYVVVGIFTRGKKIAQLEREMSIMSDASAESLPDEAELKELESLVDEALKSSQKKPKTKAAKKSKATKSKKTTRKTKKTKKSK